MECWSDGGLEGNIADKEESEDEEERGDERKGSQS